MKILNKYSAQNMHFKGETFTLPSLTGPDQAMTIKQLIERFQRGIPLGGQREIEYNDGDDILNGVDPRTLDISEKFDMIDRLSSELLDIKDKIKFREKEKNKARQQDEQLVVPPVVVPREAKRNDKQQNEDE